MGIGVVGPKERLTVPDESQAIPRGFVIESESEFIEVQRRIARALEGQSRLVDEYQSQSGATTARTSIELQPQFELFYELIDHIIVTGPITQNQTGFNVRNTVTNPGAGVIIANAGVIPLGQVVYVNWTVSLEGTVTSADADNFKLCQASTSLLGSLNEGVVGEYPQQPVYYTGDGVSVLCVRSIAAASGASAIYGAQITATPQLPTFTLQLGDRFWNLALPAIGLLEFSAHVLLGRNDRRILTSPVSGAWTLELTGRADVRNRS